MTTYVPDEILPREFVPSPRERTPRQPRVRTNSLVDRLGDLIFDLASIASVAYLFMMLDGAVHSYVPNVIPMSYRSILFVCLAMDFVFFIHRITRPRKSPR